MGVRYSITLNPTPCSLTVTEQTTSMHCMACDMHCLTVTEHTGVLAAEDDEDDSAANDEIEAGKAAAMPINQSINQSINY